MPRLTLLTDFGTSDGYAGAMKGVIASMLPQAIVDDISHDIPPGDVAAAAWTLGAYWRRYPRGTVHLVVVDPGVGTMRRALAAEADGRFLVAPDNGVLSWALREAGHASAIRAIEPLPDGVSATFHGRDVFAPAAARLAAGGPFEEIGTRVGADAVVRLPWPEPTRGPTGIDGVVIHVDRFGNLTTNLAADDVRAYDVRVTVGDDAVAMDVGQIRRTYADVGPGEVVALVGSRGLVEISVRDGRADESLRAARGTAVRLAIGM